MSKETQENDGLTPVFESDLPETGKDLIRMLGQEIGARFIRKLGGVPFPVPVAENSNPQGAARFSLLVELCGEAGAKNVVAEYGGTHLLVPTCYVARSRERWRRIAAFYDTGATLEETALAFGITSRAVSYGLKGKVVEGHGYVIHI